MSTTRDRKTAASERPMPEAKINFVFAGGPLAGKIQQQLRPELNHCITIHYVVKGESVSHCYAGRYGGGQFFQLTYLGIAPLKETR